LKGERFSAQGRCDRAELLLAVILAPEARMTTERFLVFWKLRNLSSPIEKGRPLVEWPALSHYALMA